jgi:hypothetical protein
VNAGYVDAIGTGYVVPDLDKGIEALVAIPEHRFQPQVAMNIEVAAKQDAVRSANYTALAKIDSWSIKDACEQYAFGLLEKAGGEKEASPQNWICPDSVLRMQSN